MKRIITIGIISLFLLTACTAEISNKEEPFPTPTGTQQNGNLTIETQENETTSQNQIGSENVLTNGEEAVAFLKKASETTSNLETVSFLSLVYYTTYINDLSKPENNYFNEFNGTYEGTMQRTPKLADIVQSFDISSGTLGSEGDYLYDESTQISTTNEDYFDPELGWFTVSGEFSYGGVVTNDDEQSDIRHEDLDSNFKTLEHMDAFMQLFMSYPNQLSIYKDKIEDMDEEYELDNWIVELNLTNEQYFEHFYKLEYNFFTGSYFDVQSNQLPLIELESLTDLYLALTFDPSYNLVQLTVFHTYKVIGDYVDADANRDDYTTTRYFTFFSDHNAPYTNSIPEEVLLNADYD